MESSIQLVKGAISRAAGLREGWFKINKKLIPNEGSLNAASARQQESVFQKHLCIRYAGFYFLMGYIKHHAVIFLSGAILFHGNHLSFVNLHSQMSGGHYWLCTNATGKDGMLGPFLL